MESVPIEFIAFIGIMLGVIGRTYFPYLKKTNENTYKASTISFNYQYIATMIFTGIVTTIFIFSGFTIPTGRPYEVFFAAFIFGWAFNDIVNRLVK